jgi:hypothetical protein
MRNWSIKNVWKEEASAFTGTGERKGGCIACRLLRPNERKLRRPAYADDEIDIANSQIERRSSATESRKCQIKKQTENGSYVIARAKSGEKKFYADGDDRE